MARLWEAASPAQGSWQEASTDTKQGTIAALSQQGARMPTSSGRPWDDGGLMRFCGSAGELILMWWLAQWSLCHGGGCIRKRPLQAMWCAPSPPLRLSARCLQPLHVEGCCNGRQHDHPAIYQWQGRRKGTRLTCSSCPAPATEDMSA